MQELNNIIATNSNNNSDGLFNDFIINVIKVNFRIAYTKLKTIYFICKDKKAIIIEIS